VTRLRAALVAAVVTAALSPSVLGPAQPPAPALAQFAVPLPGPPRPELKPGPGSGYRTLEAPMIRPLRPDVSVTPILSCGDTLVAAEPGEEPYTFAALPDGIGVLPLDRGVVQIFVTHELDWTDGLGGARVSRLDLDTRTLGVLSADYVVDGAESYARLHTASVAGAAEGFLQPRLLINEDDVESPRGGMVAAVDVRAGTVADLPWLGRFSHAGTLIVPVSSGRLIAILTEDGDPGASQLYMYVAETDGEFLSGAGQLYVFRKDGPGGGSPALRLASSVTRQRPGTGRFVPVPSGEGVSALALEDAVQRSGCLNFVRLQDAALDRRRLDAFYFADTGDPDFFDRASGRRVSGNGRLYHVVLDPFDPTRVTELSVVLDGDEGDDLYRPDNLDTDESCVMIQENPGVRGLHPARILSYNVLSRRLDPIAECAERDRQGQSSPKGVGGEWSATGILNVSDLFGEDAWLLTVQAHTLRTPMFGRRGQGGQLLLLRGPRFPRKTG
jgi:uncharacterized protein DUF839